MRTLKNTGEYIIFILAMFFCAESVIAQNTTRVFDIPEKYIRTIVNTQFNDAYKPARFRTWTVYSDQHNNLTYTQPYGKLIQKVTPMMDQFYVIEKNGDYLHIIKDFNLSQEGFLSELAQDCGWIHYENLLLTEHCLVNEQMQPIKAIIANIPVRYYYNQNGDKICYSDTIFIYEDPKLRFKSAKSIRHHDIHYVYKIDENAVLIGNNYRLPNDKANECILGWVPKENILLWDNRIALEPNWDVYAANERKNNNIKASLFFDPVSASLYSLGNNIEDNYIIWNNDSFNERMEGNKLRFPIIARNDNILKVGIWGNLYNDSIPEYENNNLNINQFTGAIENYPYVFDNFNESIVAGDNINKTKFKLHNHFYQEAYTSINNSLLRSPVFRYVYLISREELGMLINIYEKITDYETDRSKLQVVILELAKQRLPDTDAAYIPEMPIMQLLPLVFNVPVHYNYFDEALLRDITYFWRVSDNDFKYFTTEIKNKINKLKSILNNDNYPYSFRSNNIPFYWIECEMLI